MTVDINQGDAMGRPSRLRATAFAGDDGTRRSTVTGQAVLTSAGEVDLPAGPAEHRPK